MLILDTDHLTEIDRTLAASSRLVRRLNESGEEAISADYKAHRPDPPAELVPQFPLIREAVRAFNVACIEQEGFEADECHKRA